MGIYQAGPAGTYCNIFGGGGSGGTGQPGGAIDSIQYNVDGENFGGFGTYNSVTGLVTLPQHLILENNTNSNFQINNITFEQDGNGLLFLSNDGTYKSVSVVDTGFVNSLDTGSTATLFTFPSDIFNELSIQWDSVNLQPIIVNADGSDTIFYSFRSVWDLLTLGYPSRHYQYTQTLAGTGNIILNSSNSFVSGLDLSTEPSNIDLYLSVYSQNTDTKILLTCTFFVNQFTLGTQQIEVKGQYEVVQ